MRLILASSSPRRRELLAAAGYQFEVAPPSPSAEDAIGAGESPAQFVARLAYQKAADVVPRFSVGLILACDTVAECRGEILGKPRDQAHARHMLRLLRGNDHRVFSGVCLWPLPDGAIEVGVDCTSLRMDSLSDAAVEAYLASGQWQGKAGAFGYQDGLDWVHIVQGSESNVVGLPLELLRDMLARSGLNNSG